MLNPLVTNANASWRQRIPNSGALLASEPAKQPEPPAPAYKPYADGDAVDEPYKPYADKPAHPQTPYEPYKDI